MFYFIILWQKGEQMLTLAPGFLKARQLMLLRDCSQMSVAESPLVSHTLRKPAERARCTGSSRFSAKLSSQGGEVYQVLGKELLGGFGLLQLLLCRAHSC